MNRFRMFAGASMISLAACAQQPATTPDVLGAGDRIAQAGAATPGGNPKPGPNLPAQELNRRTLLQFLVAEMAASRGQYQLAAQAYLELARATRDPRVARRATDLAFYSRQLPIAQEAATLWLQADPESVQARQTMAVIMVAGSRLEDVRPHLEIWLAADKDNVAQSFLQLNGLLARHADKAAALVLTQDLARAYPSLPEAQLAVAQAAWNAGNVDATLAAAQAASKLRPEWEAAALFQAQALQRRSNGEAIGFLSRFLNAHPKSKDVRLNYARLLSSDRRYDDARKEFEALTREFPGNADVTMAVGLLAFQLHDYDAAEKYLKRVLEIGPKDPDAVRLYLGNISEERKNYDQALEWFRQIGEGDQFLPAQARIALVMGKQGKVSEARSFLKKIEPADPQQQVLLTQTEAQVLRDSSAFKDAYELLGGALAKLPDNPDLLYDHAMAAEKVDRIDVMETNLRKLIVIKPDHAHAYNALGYTLADRTDRLKEAHGLIETALKLAPEDPFIMDSMGWVLFRLGDLKGGHEYLARAYKTRPDAEIAAHLGEVLWAQGRRDEAEKLWRAALKDNPSNELLQGVLKKFLP